MDAPLLKIEESSKPFESPLFQDQDPWELGMWTNWQSCSQSKYATRPGGTMPNQNIKLSGFPKFWVGELSARVAVLGTRSRHPTKCSALRSQPQFLLNSHFQKRENLAQKNGLNWSIGSNECKRYGELFFVKFINSTQVSPKINCLLPPPLLWKRDQDLIAKKGKKSFLVGWSNLDFVGRRTRNSDLADTVCQKLDNLAKKAIAMKFRHSIN